jgi:membrane protein
VAERLASLVITLLVAVGLGRVLGRRAEPRAAGRARRRAAEKAGSRDAPDVSGAAETSIEVAAATGGSPAPVEERAVLDAPAVGEPEGAEGGSTPAAPDASPVGRVKALVAWFQATALGRFLAKWQADDGPSLAIVLAYYALFSMLPLLLALISVAGFALRDPERLAQLTASIDASFPPDLRDAVRGALDAARDNAGGTGLLSILGLLWSGSGLFGAAQKVLGNVYRVEPRGFVASKVVSLLLTAVFIVMLLLAVAAYGLAEVLGSGPIAQELAQGLGIPVLAQGGRVLAYVVSLAALVVLFIAIYRIVPKADQRLREVVPGSVFAALAFALATQLFPAYLRAFGASFAAYATFGLVLIVMLWFYILGNIVVLGGEINAFTARPHLRDPAHPNRTEAIEGESPG